MNIAIITFDSLRYDSAMMANTPNFKRLFGADTWHKVYTHGTFTLPVHSALFQGGFLPATLDANEPAPYNRTKGLLFRPELHWNRHRPALYSTPEAANIVKGFAKLSYRTIGIGGVHWFNTDFETSRFWKEHYFEEFYWQEDFSENFPDALERQMALMEKLNLRAEQKLFFFLNIASTHTPFRGLGQSRTAQVQCFEYVDSHLPRLLSLLPRPCHLVMFGDHGECFTEQDGVFGHGFYHPSVMEVPMISLIARD